MFFCAPWNHTHTYIDKMPQPVPEGLLINNRSHANADSFNGIEWQEVGNT